MKRKKILAISGSTKKGSSCEKVLNVLSERHNDIFDLEIFNHLDQLPHFNPDQSEHPPENIRMIRSAIETADGVVFCTPEYVFSLPGSLKNIIEWSVSTTIFTSKPTAMIIAATSGEKAFESLELILKTIESRLAEDCKVLIKGVKGRFNERDELDKDVTQELDRLAKGLISSIEETSVKSSKYEEYE